MAAEAAAVFYHRSFFCLFFSQDDDDDDTRVCDIYRFYLPVVLFFIVDELFQFRLGTLRYDVVELLKSRDLFITIPFPNPVLSLFIIIIHSAACLFVIR